AWWWGPYGAACRCCLRILCNCSDLRCSWARWLSPSVCVPWLAGCLPSAPRSRTRPPCCVKNSSGPGNANRINAVPPSPTPPTSHEAIVSEVLALEQVVKTYQARDGSDAPVLQRVSLTVRQGEFKVVHGSSGSGKSTLLLAAGGLLQPDSGTVRV